MKPTKQQIEKEYFNAMYNNIAPSTFASTILEMFGVTEKVSRSGAQNRARWKYLEMCSSILKEKGFTYNPPGTTIEVLWTKDNLYEIYWQTTRKHMFPNKKRQLSTKEFSELVDMIQMLFAKVFEITIPFPNWESMTLNS
jgi:hypothetical protein